MWLRNKAPIIAFLAVLFTLVTLLPSGCGYRLAGSLPSVLGDGSKTIKIKSVEQPTLYPWMVYLIRGSVRDEISSRNLARWVDDGPADYELGIAVNAFTMSGSVRSSRTESVLAFTGTLSMAFTVYDGHTNSEVWNSGLMSYSETYDTNDERSGAEILTRELVRRMVIKMRGKF